MSFEDTLTTLLEAKLLPISEALRGLAQEVESVRRALPPVLVTLREASRRLGVSESTVRRRVRDGQLRTLKIGGLVRVDLGVLHGASAEDVDRKVLELKRGGRP